MSGEVMAQPQAQLPKQVDVGSSEYTFSSAAFRKKKKKKLHSKKIITSEEAVSRRCRPKQGLSRSQSTSALVRKTHQIAPKAYQLWDSPKSKTKKNSEANSAAVVTSSSPAPTTAASAESPPSHVRRNSTTKSRGQRELELELELSNHTREIRKPWETDIRKKNKTEYGDSLLRDGPTSADRITTNRAASRHSNFRRARSLSISATRNRNRSSSRYSTNRKPLFSDWYSSDSEDEFCNDDNDDELTTTSIIQQYEEDEKQSSLDNYFEDQTYEKYRQFLASTKSNNEDETMSRQSVLSLKQKVGAAPALDFAYRYSTAADELLNTDHCEDNSTALNPGSSKCNTEETTNLTEPEDLTTNDGNDVISGTGMAPSIRLGEVVNSRKNMDFNLSDDDSKNEEKLPGFVGDIVDVRSDDKKENGESRCKDEEVAGQKESSPVPLSASSLQLTALSSPIRQSPISTVSSSTTEELSFPPISRPPEQKEEDCHDVEKTDSSLLSWESKAPICEVESSLSPEKKSDMESGESDIPSTAISKEEEDEDHLDSTNITSCNDESSCQDGIEQTVYDSDQQHQNAQYGAEDKNESLPNKEVEVLTRDDDFSSDEIYHQHQQCIDDYDEVVSKIQDCELEPSQTSQTSQPLAPSPASNPTQDLAGGDEDGDNNDTHALYKDINHCQGATDKSEGLSERLPYEPTVSSPLTPKSTPGVLNAEETNLIQDNIEIEDGEHQSSRYENDCGTSPFLAQSPAPILDSEEIYPIQGVVKEEDGERMSADDESDCSPSVARPRTQYPAQIFDSEEIIPIQCLGKEEDDYYRSSHDEIESDTGTSQPLIQSPAQNLNSKEMNPIKGPFEEEDGSRGGVGGKVQNNDDISELGGDYSMAEDMEEDLEYHQEDRTLFSMMYGIHMR